MEAFSAETVHPPGIITITSDKSEEGGRNTNESTVSGLEVDGEDSRNETLIETPSVIFPPESPRNEALGKTQFSFSIVSVSSTFDGPKIVSPTEELPEAADEKPFADGDICVKSNLSKPKSQRKGPPRPENPSGSRKKESVSTDQPDATTDGPHDLSGILQEIDLFDIGQAESGDVPFDEVSVTKTALTTAEEKVPDAMEQDYCCDDVPKQDNESPDREETSAEMVQEMNMNDNDDHATVEESEEIILIEDSKDECDQEEISDLNSKEIIENSNDEVPPPRIDESAVEEVPNAMEKGDPRDGVAKQDYEASDEDETLQEEMVDEVSDNVVNTGIEESEEIILLENSKDEGDQEEIYEDETPQEEMVDEVSDNVVNTGIEESEEINLLENSKDEGDQEEIYEDETLQEEMVDEVSDNVVNTGIEESEEIILLENSKDEGDQEEISDLDSKEIIENSDEHPKSESDQEKISELLTKNSNEDFDEQVPKGESVQHDMPETIESSDEQGFKDESLQEKLSDMNTKETNQNLQEQDAKNDGVQEEICHVISNDSCDGQDSESDSDQQEMADANTKETNEISDEQDLMDREGVQEELSDVNNTNETNECSDIEKNEEQDHGNDLGPTYPGVQAMLGYPHNYKAQDELVIKILAEVHAAAYQPTSSAGVNASQKQNKKEIITRKPERNEQQEEAPEPTEEELKMQRLKKEAKDNKKKEETDLVAKILAEVHATVEPFIFSFQETEEEDEKEDEKEDDGSMKVEREIINETAMNCTDMFEIESDESGESEMEEGHTMEGFHDGVDYMVTRILAEGLIHKQGTGNDWLGSQDWKLRHARLVLAKVKGYDIEVPVLLIYWLRLSPTPSTVIVLDSAAVIPIDKADTSQLDAYCFDVAQIKSATEVTTRKFAVSKAARDEWVYAINQSMQDFDTRKLEAKKDEKTMARTMPSLADESDANQEKSKDVSEGATATFINALSKQHDVMEYLKATLFSEDEDDQEEEKKQQGSEEMENTEDSKSVDGMSNDKEAGTTESASQEEETVDDELESQCATQSEPEDTQEQTLPEQQPTSLENQVESKKTETQETPAVQESYVGNALKLLFSKNESVDDVTEQKNVNPSSPKVATKSLITAEEKASTQENVAEETSTDLALVEKASNTLFDALVSGLGCTSITSPSNENIASDIVAEGREDDARETAEGGSTYQEAAEKPGSRELPSDEEVEQAAAEIAYTGCEAQVEAGEACASGSPEIDILENKQQSLATIRENPEDDASVYCGAEYAF